MVINLNEQYYNGGFLPGILMLTHASIVVWLECIILTIAPPHASDGFKPIPRLFSLIFIFLLVRPVYVDVSRNI